MSLNAVRPTRQVLPHSTVVLHQPSTEEGSFEAGRGTLPDLAVQADEVARVRAQTDRILSRHTGHPVAKIHADIDRRRTFGAEEAVAYGIADQVIAAA